MDHTELLPTQRIVIGAARVTWEKWELPQEDGGGGAKPAWRLELLLRVSSIQVKCSGSGARLPGMSSSPTIHYNVTWSKLLNFSMPQFSHL